MWQRIKKYYWISLCIIVVFILIGIRFTIPEGTRLSDLMNNGFYLETKFYGIYAILFILCLFPVVKEWDDYRFVIRMGHHKTFTRMLLKISMYAISFSSLLTIGIYLIDGSKCVDCFTGKNIIYICTLFCSQAFGWFFIGVVYLGLYMLFRKKIIVFLLTEFLLIGLNSATYVNDTVDLEKYIRMFLFMFHVEYFSSMFSLVSVISLYMMVAAGICFIIERYCAKREIY